MKKFIFILIVFIIVLAAPTLATAEGGNRGVIFQLGAGAGFPFYPGVLDDEMSYMDSLPGIDRIKLSLDLALGYAVSQQIYILGRVDGIGDRIYDSDDDYIQVNIYLFSLGLRFYPWTTGLYLEGGAGASRGVTMSSSEADSTSDVGLGYGAAIGYDFAAKTRGFGLSLEAKYIGLQIEGETYGGFMLTLNLCWK